MFITVQIFKKKTIEFVYRKKFSIKSVSHRKELIVFKLLNSSTLAPIPAVASEYTYKHLSRFLKYLIPIYDITYL